jgi:hypothetical protein
MNDRQECLSYRNRQYILLKNDRTYHIDEQTLELFVLGAPEVSAQKEHILEHLSVCAVCRATVQDFESLYANAAEEKQEIEQRPEISSKALIPAITSVEPHFEKFEYRHGLRPIVGLSRLKRFVYARPVTSAVGGVGLLAACLAGLLMFNNNRNINNNPSFVTVNDQNKLTTVYNKNQQLLWQVPLSNQFVDVNLGIFPALVSDLDGDGKNEVVVSGISNENTGERMTSLTVYNYDQSLRFEKSFSERLRYGPYSYDEKLITGFVLSIASGKANESNILVNCRFTRSPNSIVIIDRKGDVVGEYWHYGYFFAGYLSKIEGIDHKVMILLGLNDASDTIAIDNDNDAIIAVVDPLKIHGRSESSATRGFGMERSAAELYYIKLPVSDMVRALETTTYPFSMVSESDSIIACGLGANRDHRLPVFHFLFNRRMEPVAVKSVDGNKEVFDSLKKQKKISSVLNQQYLDDMKKRIQYWNGKEWQSEVTRVK